MEVLKGKICDNIFDEDVKTHNCNCIERFIAMHDDFDFGDYTYERPIKFDKIVLNGMPVSVQVDVLVSRVTRTNKARIGALMLRYAKGKALSEKAGLHQSAFIYEFFRQPQFEKQGESEKALCITLDGHSAVGHKAPGNATYLFKEMAATCASLIERWPAIKPPPGAIL